MKIMYKGIYNFNCMYNNLKNDEINEKIFFYFYEQVKYGWYIIKFIIKLILKLIYIFFNLNQIIKI